MSRCSVNMVKIPTCYERTPYDEGTSSELRLETSKCRRTDHLITDRERRVLLFHVAILNKLTQNLRGQNK